MKREQIKFLRTKRLQWIHYRKYVLLLCFYLGILALITLCIILFSGTSTGSKLQENHQVEDTETEKTRSLRTATVKPKKEKSPSREEVSKLLKYWKLPELADTGLHRVPEAIVGDRYVLFETDCGGFNNIRMAFEYFILMAWLTKRVLVLPPASPWYLIDFGPFTRMKPETQEQSTTTYDEFFDMEHLRAAVSVISTEEFLKIEGMRIKLPEEVLYADLKTNKGRQIYRDWMFAESDDKSLLEWAPLQYVLYYPSIRAVEDRFGIVPKDFVHHRVPIEITEDINKKQLIVFPSCKNNDKARFLGQVASFAAFADEALSRSYKRLLRDHVHFRSVVFDIASYVVQKLGLFNYAAIHLRRNDLQYKEVFMSAESLLEHITPVLDKYSSINKIYISTDEQNEEFFKPIKEKYSMSRWLDFTTGFATEGIEIPRKLEGCVEQVICAGGLLFFGTLESTFSSYIFRLRGYINTPNKEIYFHTLQYTGDVEQDRAVTYSKKPPKGQIYKSEHPSIWEDAVSMRTFW